MNWLAWHTVIETQMGNLETELDWSLRLFDTPETGKCIDPLYKVAEESDHLILLRDGRARSIQPNLLGGDIHGVLSTPLSFEND